MNRTGMLAISNGVNSLGLNVVGFVSVFFNQAISSKFTLIVILLALICVLSHI
jgi:hypothetical protein